jgi:hypothetical protein
MIYISFLNELVVGKEVGYELPKVLVLTRGMYMFSEKYHFITSLTHKNRIY